MRTQAARELNVTGVMREFQVAVDIGGSFTDAVACDELGNITTAKIPTRPADLSGSFADSVAAVLAKLPCSAPPRQILYGTTLATNALLEHRLAAIALIVTAGFREILETNGVHNEDHHEPSAGPIHRHRLVPLEYVHELDERIESDGSVRRALRDEDVAKAARAIANQGIRVAAVALLHSYRNPRHEQRVRAIIEATVPDFSVVLSSDVLPEFREYERTVTTCLNAALLPLMQEHLRSIARTTPAPVLVMKSSGGLATVANTLRNPLLTTLSGPSAAVIGMTRLARHLGIGAAISLDIGGTSTDVALIEDGKYAVTTRAEVGGYPLKAPTIDLLTIGAGGGSIARLGADQRWHVGPQSAGAMPGPVCFGNGATEVTLTDAHCVLGRLPAGLLGGDVRLDRARATRALAAFGQARGLDAVGAALGILKIASHTMCGAIRRISVMRGHDPRHFALFAIGGAGPLHAAELAELLGIMTVVVPRYPGLAAAEGLLSAAIHEDCVQTYPQREGALDIGGIAAHFAALEDRVRAQIGDAAEPSDLILTRSADLRYAGMAAEFTVPIDAGPVTQKTLLTAIEAFHRRHEVFSGHAYRGTQDVELINLRVQAEQPAPALPLLAWRPNRVSITPQSVRPVYFMDAPDFVDTPVFKRDSLPADWNWRGPAVVEQIDSTILVPPGFTLHIDGCGNILIQRA